MGEVLIDKTNKQINLKKNRRQSARHNCFDDFDDVHSIIIKDIYTQVVDCIVRISMVL